MIAGLRALLHLRPRSDRPAISAPARSRRGTARAALGCGLVAFALATAGLAVTVETAKPEWRDPEYGHRLRQLRTWKTVAPDRPLVVMFGSSRTQMGICPAAMNFPDEPGSPVVYNFGYRAGRLSRSWLQLMRVLDSGPKPDFVLIQLSMVDLIGGVQGDFLPTEWGGRLGAGDFRRLAPYLPSQVPIRRAWTLARLTGWSAHRVSIVSDVMPSFQQESSRQANYYWERLDRYGFAPHHLEAIPAAQQESLYERSRAIHAKALESTSVSPIVDKVVGDAIARCRAEGIPVGFFWAPEAMTYQSWYTTGAREAMKDYHHRLTTEFGIPVFPAPTDLPDTDFADGFHLLRHGAEKYSRWLADTHLKPWLAQDRK